MSPSRGTAGLSERDSLPSPAFGGLENGIGNLIGREAVAKGWRRGFPFTKRLQKIGRLVNEGMLIPDLQAGDPPALHVRVIPVGDVNASPAAKLPFIAMIEILNPVQIVQVPHGGGVLPVDFEGVESLVAAGVARGFESRQRAVRKAAEE